MNFINEPENKGKNDNKITNLFRLSIYNPN